MNDFLNEISPVELTNGIYVKRNDKLNIYDVNGGKSQGVYFLITKAILKNYKSVTTVGSRFSPQCDIVSDICENENIKCHLFMPLSKNETSIIEKIKRRNNSELHFIPYGYTSNLIYNAQKFCAEHNSYFIPFGMKCQENIDVISKQCSNIPESVKRIIVPVGSGVTMCGIIKGLSDFDRKDVKVLGVQTGANSAKFINSNLPIMNEIDYKLVYYKPDLSPSKRYEETSNVKLGDINLNERYESKCFDFIKKGDLFWIVGR